jgi:hypothetical protein
MVWLRGSWGLAGYSPKSVYAMPVRSQAQVPTRFINQEEIDMSKLANKIARVTGASKRFHQVYLENTTP